MKERLRAQAQEFAPEAVTLVVLVALIWIFMAKGILNDRDLIQPIM